MSRRAAFTSDDYARAVAGAIKGGLPVGSFKIAVENGALAILPANAGEPLPSEPATTPAEEALARWRRSA